MTDSTDIDVQELAVQQAQRRRSDVRGWLAVLGFILLCGLSGWMFSGDAAWLAVCGFLAVYPVLMLLYTLVYLLNPWSSPTTIQRRIVAAWTARQRAPARVLFANGIMFVASSLFFLLGGVARGLEESGPWGAVGGALFGLLWLGIGVGMIVWSKRS